MGINGSLSESYLRKMLRKHSLSISIGNYSTPSIKLMSKRKKQTYKQKKNPETETKAQGLQEKSHSPFPCM